MVSVRTLRGGFSDGGFSQKVVSLTTYDMSVLSSLHMNQANKQNIERGAANIVARYFDSYIDAKARANPKSLHHVYEFDMAGDSNARLFKGQIKSTPAGAVISYRFVKAKKPNREGYPFENKASVMELGEPVVIRPKRKDFLQYKLDDGRFVRASMSVVENPGGDVAGNFANEVKSYTSNKAKTVLREFGYFEKINSAYKAKRKVVVPRINSGTMQNAKMQAEQDARMISVQAEAITGG